MRLFQSQDQSHGFDRLTRVKSCHFFYFFLEGYLSLMNQVMGLVDLLRLFFMFFLIDFFF